MMWYPPLLAVIFSTPLAAIASVVAVAAAPVIIHLLNRKRHVIVPWAAMRFLLAAQKKNVRRLRLEQWLLLAVRMLIGILIVTAMCAVMDWTEPLWKRFGLSALPPSVSHGRTHRIIVIDGSFSMAANADGDANRFDRAKAQAKLVLDRSAPGDGFSVVFLTSSAQVVVQGPVDDRQKVAEEIDELELPNGNADVAGGLRIVTEMAQKRPEKYTRSEVVFITDLKRSGWPMLQAKAATSSGEGTASSVATLAGIGKEADIVFIDVALRDAENLSVSSLLLGDTLAFVDGNTSAIAMVQNHGKKDITGLQVELQVGQAPKPGEKLVLNSVGKQLIDVKAGRSVPVTFPLENQNRFRTVGDHILQATIKTSPDQDALSIDNTRSLAVKIRDTIPVLIVNGTQAVDARESPGEWVRQALRPDSTDTRKSESPIVPTLVTPAQFADRFQTDLTKFECVFLCDLPAIDAREMERLDAFLRRGGSVVICLGPNTAENLESLNRTLFNEGQGLLPGKMLGIKKAEDSDYFTLSAEEDAFKQPPLSAYRDDRERTALTMPQFHQYIRLQAPANGPARRIFSFLPTSGTGKNEAKSAAGLDPAIVDFPRHRGRVIIHTTTFSTTRVGQTQFWSTWPPHPTFLPFMHELVRYAVAGIGKRNLLAGEILDEDLPVTLTGLKAKLIRGEGDTEIEVEKESILSRDETAHVAFTKTDRLGIYRVSIASRLDNLFAVNLPVVAPGGGSESD
ncbi:MAG: VWA domain-containing protein, partial [Planctomycetes bacterium]|nr:VWA domain-containing protein [Planctomycetota bacterium]